MTGGPKGRASRATGVERLRNMNSLLYVTQYCNRPGLQRVLGQASEKLRGHFCLRRVEYQFPVLIPYAGTEAERGGSVVCIEQDKEPVANDAPALSVGFIYLAAGQAHAQAAGISGIPVLF